MCIKLFWFGSSGSNGAKTDRIYSTENVCMVGNDKGFGHSIGHIVPRIYVGSKSVSAFKSLNVFKDIDSFQKLYNSIIRYNFK